MMGVIVLTLCACLSECVFPLSPPNRQTYGREFWHGGQVKGHLGQVCRSRSLVKSQGHKVKNVHWDIPLTSDSFGYIYMDWQKKLIRKSDMECFQSLCDYY